MKMVRSLLLGAAAGFVAIAGAQAADLPVKAKPVQYVKICDLYGVGYYYIPGTDTCIKIGGYIRVNAYYDARGSLPLAGTAPYAGLGAQFNRTQTQDVVLRSRMNFSTDVRSQTSMGTLRSYMLLQATNGLGATGAGSENPAAFEMVRGFVQFAGFTVGRAVSAAEVPDVVYPVITNAPGTSSAASAITGVNVFQYTAQFGNGVSATISIDSADIRARPVVNLGTGVGANAWGVMPATALGPTTSSQSSGVPSRNVPDLTANLTVTQAWGTAAIVGALHNNNANYYTGVGGFNGVVGGAACPGVPASTIACGHPGDAWGYFIGAGVVVTAIPGLPGDAFSFATGYGVGATGYALGLSSVTVMKGNTYSVGAAGDGTYANGTNVEMTTAWYLQTGYMHAWRPGLSSSIYGGYTAVTYNSNATAMICTTAGAAPYTPIGTGLILTGGAGQCNPNYDYWNLGVRVFQWTPVPNLDIGLDLGWQHYDTAFAGAAIAGAANGPQPAGQALTLGNNDVQSMVFQVTRAFWP